jgi:integrase
MTKDAGRLTPRMVAAAGSGWLSDGNHLYLRVDGPRRRWICRVVRSGKKTEYGLGSVDATSLMLARKKRDQLLEQLRDGVDPKEERRKAREARTKVKQHTFGEAYEAVIAARREGWRTSHEGRASSENDWVHGFVTHCASLRKRPVADIDLDDVKGVVLPLWNEGKHVTARRLLNRIELVLEYALAHNWRTGDNPATWKRFQHIAPKAPNGKQHHRALHWRDMPTFMTKLRAKATISALAVEFIALTGVRCGEARGMRWPEVDWTAKTWTVPASRMKRGIEFAVPLSRQAIDLLKRLEGIRGEADLVFEGDKPGAPLNASAILDFVQRIEPEMTIHGIRASLRSWMGDAGYEFAMGEAMLAHAPGDATVQAYHRASMLERRRPILQAWCDMLDGVETANVVQLAARVRP